MKNVDAYKTEGFEEWLKNYTLQLDDSLRHDIFVSCGGCTRQLVNYDVKTMKKEGLSDNDIIDYVRLHKGWTVGAYDGAFRATNASVLFDKDFRLDNNDTYTDNLKALRFILFMDQEFNKDKHIKIKR